MGVDAKKILRVSTTLLSGAGWTEVICNQNFGSTRVEQGKRFVAVGAQERLRFENLRGLFAPESSCVYHDSN